MSATRSASVTLKKASLWALVGTLFLTILLVVELIFDILNVVRGLVPPASLLSALIESFAAVVLTVFFYVFHEVQ
jgi:hypothetical protein